MGTVDSVVHRIESLPGDGRYAVSFQRPDGSEQTAVVHISAETIQVAEASLPSGWTRDTDLFRATASAVAALDAARRLAPTAAILRDVDGGWDVSMGNVVLGPTGVPRCTEHGDLQPSSGHFACPECGAAALLG